MKLAEEFERFVSVSFGDISELQKIEVKRVFYAGVLTGITWQGSPVVLIEELVEFLEEVKKEMHDRTVDHKVSPTSL